MQWKTCCGRLSACEMIANLADPCMSALALDIPPDVFDNCSSKHYSERQQHDSNSSSNNNKNKNN